MSISVVPNLVNTTSNSNLEGQTIDTPQGIALPLNLKNNNVKTHNLNTNKTKAKLNEFDAELLTKLGNSENVINGDVSNDENINKIFNDHPIIQNKNNKNIDSQKVPVKNSNEKSLETILGNTKIFNKKDESDKIAQKNVENLINPSIPSNSSIPSKTEQPQLSTKTKVNNENTKNLNSILGLNQQTEKKITSKDIDLADQQINNTQILDQIKTQQNSLTKSNIQKSISNEEGSLTNKNLNQLGLKFDQNAKKTDSGIDTDNVIPLKVKTGPEPKTEFAKNILNENNTEMLSKNFNTGNDLSGIASKNEAARNFSGSELDNFNSNFIAKNNSKLNSKFELQHSLNEIKSNNDLNEKLTNSVQGFNKNYAINSYSKNNSLDSFRKSNINTTNEGTLKEKESKNSSLKDTTSVLDKVIASDLNFRNNIQERTNFSQIGFADKLDMQPTQAKNTQNLIDNITNYVMQNANANKDEIQLKVKDDIGGNININIKKSKTSDDLNIKITVDNPEIREMLTTNNKELVSQLNSVGIKVQSFKIEGQNFLNTKSEFKDGSSSFSQNQQSSFDFRQNSSNPQSDKREDSDRRQHLWEMYRERMSA